MKDMWRRKKARKFSPKSKVLSGVTSLAMVIGLGSVVRIAAPVVPDSVDVNAHELSLSETDLVDPFTLNTIVLARENSPDGDISVLGGAETGTPIWIPYRPALRSPVRPPLVHR